MQVVRPDVPDQGQVLADGEDDRNRTRAVQLRLEEARVDLLQLLDAIDALDVRAVRGFGCLLQCCEVVLGDERRRDRVGENRRLELIDLVQREAGLVDRRHERVVERHQGRDSEVDHHEHHDHVDEDSEQAVDAADRLHAVERSPDRASDRAQDHGRDQGNEDADHGVDMDQLLHLGRVLVVEPEHQQQGAEKEDLGHQRLDHASLVAEE